MLTIVNPARIVTAKPPAPNTARPRNMDAIATEIPSMNKAAPVNGRRAKDPTPSELYKVIAAAERAMENPR